MNTTLRLRTVKNIVGPIVVVLHGAAFLLAYRWLEPPRMSHEDFTLVIRILFPVTSVYALAYLREVARTMKIGSHEPDDDSKVSLRFTIASIAVTTSFSLFVIYVLYSYSEGSTQTPNDLHLSLLNVEIGLGAFTGLFFDTLFGKSPPGATPPAQE